MPAQIWIRSCFECRDHCEMPTLNKKGNSAIRLTCGQSSNNYEDFKTIGIYTLWSAKPRTLPIPKWCPRKNKCPKY